VGTRGDGEQESMEILAKSGTTKLSREFPRFEVQGCLRCGGLPRELGLAARARRRSDDCEIREQQRLAFRQKLHAWLEVSWTQGRWRFWQLVQEDMVEGSGEEDPGDRILSVGGMWWRNFAAEVCWGQSFGQNVWANAECTRCENSFGMGWQSLRGK
jgi:hypothetical protein